MAAKSTEKEKADGQEPATPVEKPDTAASSEPLEENANEPAAENTTPAKKDGGRKRKRHLFNSIRGQMEFYFGDANLSKDRFLRRYVEQDPYVPLEIFLTFNKIKTLTQDVQQIAKALSNSQLLELDETKLKVRRKTKLPDQRDVNDKTLYVEALPANASHDWLKEVFSRYGSVAYVSLPHYPGTKKIKEFAFIEFEKAGSVEKAVKAFAQVQGVLSVETDPGELASVRSFQQQQQLQQKAESTADENDTLEPPPPPPLLKRNAKREAVAITETGPEVKRVKLEEEQPSESSTAEGTSSETEAEGTAAGEATTDQEDKTEPTDGETKKRRRKRKKKAIVDKPNIEPSALELKVLPKTSWSSLRNKYLNLQRRLISEAKSKLWRENHPQNQPHHHHHQQQHHNQNQSKPSQLPEVANKEEEAGGPEIPSEGGEAAGEAAVPVPAKRRKAVHKMNMNFYGAGGVESTKSEEPSQERTPLFKYEPGLIVECSLLEPCTNVKEFKADMRQYPDIKYVDIKEGDQVAQLRLATPAAAEELVRQVNCAERQLKVLSGQPETLYWRKIEQDREAKLSKKVRVQQKRGREKISKLLAKHIKFDDGDDEVQAAAME
ncbi:la-related protein 7 [Drosophila elegans]|uniref:la-related protein 7 n=1 Tax=Drosophila elegans TaxID=30023 RepID=UPI0007E7F4D2|nr:la-related protein 7 [Drosophila elegans]